MKKYSYLLAALTLVIAACSKEVAVVEDSISEQKEGTVVILSAVPPQFSSDTKASVDDKAFSWGDGDQISIPATGNLLGYVVFTHLSSYDENEFRGTLNPGESLTSGTAHYPVSNATPFSSIALAKKGFKMEAVYTVGDASLAFEHKSALVHLTFTNVPSFANKLVVNDGSSDVAVINFTSPASSQEFWVPIDPVGSSKTYTFKLQEGDNVLKQAKKKNVTLAASTYYDATASIPVGRIIRVQDATGWASKELYLWNGDNDALFAVGNEYPYKLLTTSSTDHYIVIPSELAWATPTTKVGVKFQDSGAVHSTQTDGIYPNRDFTFTVPAGLGMKTEYRIYPHSSSLSTIKVFVTHPLHFYVYNKANWGSIQIYRWSQKGATKVEPQSWSYLEGDGHGWFSVNDGSTVFNSQTCKELEFESSLCGGTFASSGIIVGNIKDGPRSGDLNTSFIGDIYIEFDAASSSITQFNDTKRISAAWPGDTVNSISSSVNTSAYYSFDSALYGQEVWVVFSQSGSSQKPTWVFTVDQDYDYNLD